MLNLFSIPFTRELSYSRDVIVLPWLDILHFGIFWVFLVQAGGHVKIVLTEMIFWGQEHVLSTMHVPEENSVWLTL